MEMVFGNSLFEYVLQSSVVGVNDLVPVKFHLRRQLMAEGLAGKIGCCQHILSDQKGNFPKVHQMLPFDNRHLSAVLQHAQAVADG